MHESSLIACDFSVSVDCAASVSGRDQAARGRSDCACPARRRRGIRRLRLDTSFFTSLRPWLLGLSVALPGPGFWFRLMRFSLADHLLIVMQNNALLFWHYGKQ
jgi:hypothetical protein